ncbi:MAG: RNA polymerase sigma factor [Bacteroides sp.]|nr:RNA polymerase sigma factor [Bacteroides sp.]
MNDLAKIYDKIYRYCFYKVRNSVTAEDLTQETFLKFFAQQPRIRRGEDMAYLYTIAKHLCADHFRQKQTEVLTEDYHTEDFADQSDTKIAVQNALAQLDERQREVIELRYIGELSVNETALALNISRFAVYRLERSALKEMKKHLEGVL